MKTMTSLELVLTSLGHQEPDRVPVFLLLTMHGAKELGMSIEQYFSKGTQVAEGQLRMREKYGHDCYYPFFYAPIETQAMGGDVIFRADGPPNSGAPIVDPSSIARFNPPKIEDCAQLVEVLESIRIIKEKDAEAPIIAVAISPFSLPVMQMGFEAYLQIILEDRPRFWELMEKNITFSTAWANAQLAAGATAICYFDPVSSPTMIPRELFLETGHPIADRMLAAINGPVATHLASGRSHEVALDIAASGAAVLGASMDDDLAALKETCRGKITILGTLNGIAMRGWDQKTAEQEVKACIEKAGPGGGFILADNHGEIPWQVPEEVLHHIVRAAHKWGRYPLKGG